MVSTSCACGHVKLHFAAKAPYAVGECLCSDCMGTLFMLHKKGGPPIPHAIASLDKCLQIFYIADKFKVEGQDKLKFFMIKPEPDGTTCFCFASCCHTCMMGWKVNGWFTQGGEGTGIVALWNSMTPTEYVVPKVDVRWWQKKIPPEKLANLPPLPGPFDDPEFMPKFTEITKKPVPSEGEGTSFFELLEEYKKRGGKVEIKPYTYPSGEPMWKSYT